MKPLSLDARYSSAWAEIQTRIEQRQSLFTFFITLTIAIIGLATSVSDQHCNWPIYRTLMLGSIFAATVITCMLLIMHELMIHNLHRFCAACESTATSAPGLGASYHQLTTGQASNGQQAAVGRFFEPARYARQWNDMAWFITFMAANVTASLTAAFIFAAPTSHAVVVPILALLIVGLTVAIIRSIRHQGAAETIKNTADLVKRLDHFLRDVVPAKEAKHPTDCSQKKASRLDS